MRARIDFITAARQVLNSPLITVDTQAQVKMLAMILEVLLDLRDAESIPDLPGTVTQSI